MSGVIDATALEVAVGLGLDIAWKVTVPLAAGLAASALPGSAAARHLRLTAGLVSAPVLALATVLARGGDAAWSEAPAWPVAVWALGATVGAASLARGLWELAALPTTPAGGLERCAWVTAPLTAGWWRPRIVVPVDFDSWPHADRGAALAHERAHVRRRDWLVYMGAWALGALLWFHPLLWLARRRLVFLAECAADDAVLAEGHEAVAYAELLLRMGRRGPAAALSLGRSVVGARVRRVLGRHPRGSSSSLALLVGTLILLLADGWVAEAAVWRAPEPVLGCAPDSPEPLFPITAEANVPPWSPSWSPVSSL